MPIAPEVRRRFLDDYRTIRHAEGRGARDAAYYLALPYEDLSGKSSAQWAIRAATYRYFERRVLHPVERALGRPLDVLDLGAGNGWMSYRLSLRNHRPIAIDIFRDELDGLTATQHYPKRFPVIEAEFDHLPLGDGCADLAVFNSSVHYSTDYRKTLGSALRCLRPDGRLVILDSPVYRRREHGLQMVEERHRFFEKQYGYRSDALPSIEFFDEPMIDELGRELGLRWRIYKPWYGLDWHLRPLKAWWKGKRPPSRFWILVARRIER